MAQRCVQGGLPLGAVDRHAGKHCIAGFLKIAGAGEVDKQAKGFCGESVARKIEQHVVLCQGEVSKPTRIVVEERAECTVGE